MWSKEEVEQGPTALNLTLDIGRAAYGGILTLTWGRLLKGEILMLILGGLHERHAV
jgi:hypothetical protein